MRAKIRLDTSRDVLEFCNIVDKCEGKMVIKDNTGYCVNAKSIIGALAALEFNELWLESENDYWTKLNKFIVIE